MAFSIKKFNKEKNKYTFKADDSFKYVKLAEISDKKALTVRGLFINKKSKYGAHPVAVSDECYIDLPKYSKGQVTDIMNDDEATQAINAGKVGIIREDYEQDGVTYAGFKFVDIL